MMGFVVVIIHGHKCVLDDWCIPAQASQNRAQGGIVFPFSTGEKKKEFKRERALSIHCKCALVC